MAIVTPTVDPYGSDAMLATWVLTSSDTTGKAVGPELTSQYREVTWHASGTWGGATAAAQGSNTDTDGLFGAAKDADGGSAITYTADASSVATQTAVGAFVRPKLTTAGTGASVTVKAFFTRGNRGGRFV